VDVSWSIALIILNMVSVICTRGWLMAYDINYITMFTIVWSSLGLIFVHTVYHYPCKASILSSPNIQVCLASLHQHFSPEFPKRCTYSVWFGRNQPIPYTNLIRVDQNWHRPKIDICKMDAVYLQGLPSIVIEYWWNSGDLISISTLLSVATCSFA